MRIALPTGRKGQLLALAMTVVAVALFWWGAVQPLSDWYTEQAEIQAQQEQLAFRLALVASALPNLRAQKANAPAPDAMPADVLLQGETDEIAAANLQERLQALAVSTRSSLNSVENLPVERQTGESTTSDRAIRLRVTLVTQGANFISLLDAIEKGPPLMLVDDVRLTAPRLQIQGLQMQGAPPLEANLTVTGFRHPASPTATAVSK